MAKIQPLHETITITEVVTKNLISKWNSAMSNIVTTGSLGLSNIDPVVANRYKYDYYGLLRYLGVAAKYLYPHLVANGMTNPTHYDGTVHTMTRLDNTVLHAYYTAFTR